MLATFALLAAGCSEGDGTQPTTEQVDDCPVLSSPVGEPTTGTYDTIAVPFFSEYCTTCHSTNLTTSEDRSFAPAGLNWDDEAAVRANLERIRRVVGEFHSMPPRPPLPTCEERERLVRWIDSGAP